MTGHGGKRRGSGRKPNTVKHLTAIVSAENRIRDRLPELIDNLFELAGGIEVQKTDSHGAERVYSQPPDRQANEYLINRIMGKPVERTEGEQEHRAHVTIRYVNNWRDMSALPAPDRNGSIAHVGVAD